MSEQGTGLDVFDTERVPGLQVLIGNVSCVITAIQSSYLSVIAPAEPSVINEDGNAIVIVRLYFCNMQVFFYCFTAVNFFRLLLILLL